MAAAGPSRGPVDGEEQVQVRRRTLEAVLEQCRLALELLQDADLDPVPARDAAAGEEEGSTPRSLSTVDQDFDELCDLLKSKVESSDFLEKLGSNKSVPHNMSDENASWDMVSMTDLWEDKHIGGSDESDPDGYVLVKQEDIVEGIACFMAECLLSLKQTKFHIAGINSQSTSRSPQQNILCEKEEKYTSEGMGWRQSYL
ncbi:uncharacterized protein [Elaeis guineensis]|uniref:uncharacterized protein isoform X2 n=1 Tax=Elaeis guineensis var. tenera TaxID=51953 RepID=UPI003C6D6854